MTVVSSECKTIKKLEAELERLKRILQICYELKVRWLPNDNEKLSGEVRGDVIFIYDKDEEVAINTLRHEFLDYAISQIIEPYKEVANRLIMLINEQAYRRKEMFLEILTKLLSV
ncbi:MAG: hypothetical protein H3Z53_11310 [archaeon]|nr:hypothetical protein [archaeon]MCP8314940.1 hypothetical protein [archaeon]